MEIGIAFDLKSDFAAKSGEPVDRYEEFDSLATIEGIEAALAKGGYRTRRLGGGRKFLGEVLERPSELVFNIAEGFGSRSREAHVPSVCELLGIPFTHSDPLTLAASLDKGVAKRIVSSYGIATPRFAVVEHPRELATLEVPFPLFAKPLFEGSSIGVRKRSRIADARELGLRVEQLIGDYGEPVLIEEFCAGPEFTVGIVGSGAKARVIGVMEIVPKLVPHDQFVYSLEVKQNDDWHLEVDYHVPPRRPEEYVQRVAKVALDSFRALGCLDLARVDVRADATGEPRFLEINPLPGLKPGWSDLALLCERANVAYHDLILGVVESARSRFGI